MVLHVDLEQLLQHREFLTALARGLVADPLEQDELLWETMGEGAMRPSHLQAMGDAALRPWLARVLANRVRARKRAEQRRQRHEQAGSKPEGVESAADVAARLELIQDLATHVQDLETDYRDVVLFRFFENLPPREIAKHLALPVETVKARLRRALSMLRARLDREHGARDKWLGSLLPLAYPGAKAALVGTSALGALMMTLKMKVALASLAVLLLLGAGAMYGISGANQALDVTGENPESSLALSESPGPEELSEDEVVVKHSRHRISEEQTRTSVEPGVEVEIQGRVLDPLSAPVSGARLYLYRNVAVEEQGAKAPVVARTESDENGRFRMPGLELGRYRIRVVADGWSDSHARVSFTRTRPKLLGWLVRLHAGSSLSGVVVDPQGKALAGAWIQASWSFLRGGEAFCPETRSDEEGRFTFSALPSGSEVHVLAWSEGRMLAISKRIAGNSTPLHIVLSEAGPHQLDFRLSEAQEGEGSKPRDVSVRIHVIAGDQITPLPSPIRRLEVPVSGVIRTRGLCAGTYRLSLESQEADLGEHWKLLPLTEQEPTADIEIAWQAYHRLEGRLVYEGGEPARGIRLGAAHMWEESHFAESDLEGYFRFPERFSSSRKAMVFLATGGYMFEMGSSLSNRIQMQAGDKARVLTVRRMPVLTGRVVDQKGQPVPHAFLGLLARGDRSGSFGSTVSNDQGAFSLATTGETDGPLILKAVHDSLYCPDPLVVQGKGLVSRDGIVLRLSEAASIEGSIVDGNGDGIAGVMVTANLLPEGESQSRLSIEYLKRRHRWKGAQRRAFSSRTGRFRVLGMAPGQWEVSVESAGREESIVEPIVRLARGEKRGGLRIVLSDGFSIQGRIVTDSGDPVGNAWISWSFSGEQTHGAMGSGAMRSGQPIRSDRDGNFVLEGLHAGEYSLRVQPPDSLLSKMGIDGVGSDRGQTILTNSAFETRVRAGTKDYRWLIVVPRFGEIRALIVQSGEPLQRIHVEICSGKDKRSFETPVRQGAVSMKHVLVGSYDLTFKSPRFANLGLNVDVHQDRIADLGTLELIDLDEVEGRVVDQDGKPLGDVWIGLDEQLPNLWPRYNKNKDMNQFAGRVLVNSDAHGRFRVPIKEGIRVHAFKPGYGPVARSYASGKAAKGAPPKQLILTLQRAGEISIQAPAAPEDLPPGKEERTYWSARLYLLGRASVPAGKKGPRAPKRELDLVPGKPIRVIGLQPGNYRLVAMDRAKGKSFSKKSVPGESYFEEFRVQAGSHRFVRIP